MPTADEYARKGRRRVPGWFELEDAVLFGVFDRLQVGAGVSGDLLEIGVYQGKSAILMGFFPQPGEELVVCDLFGAEADSVENTRENQAQYPRLEERKFAQHYLRHHATLPRVLKQSSLEIEPHLEGRRFRFAHIDGSHLYSAVRHDIELARRHAAEDAVMVLDDIASDHTPGVTAAGWEAVTQTDFTPLCVTKHKLYGTWSPDGVLNRDAVRRALDATGLRVYAFDFQDGPLLRVGPGREASLPARVLAPFRPPVWDFVAARLQSFR
jgi:hypothetical protein